jgi:VanZ family protein
VIMVASLLPESSPPMAAIDRLAINDVLLHFVAYGILSLLPSLRERRRVAVVLALCSLVLGLGLEVAQGLVGGRTSSLSDLSGNVAGVLCGSVPILWIRRGRARRRQAADLTVQHGTTWRVSRR